jgi:hypothetical protein
VQIRAIDTEYPVVSTGNQIIAGVVVRLVALPDPDPLQPHQRRLVVLHRHFDAAAFTVDVAAKSHFAAGVFGAGVITAHEAGILLLDERAAERPAIERGGFGFVDALVGMAGMGADDRDNGGGGTGGFRGSLGLNVRHVTLVAASGRHIQRMGRQMNACSSYLPSGAVRMSQKARLSSVLTRWKARICSFAAWDRQTNADSSEHGHSESLKYPLHDVQ